MSEKGFSLIRIFLYKERIVDSVILVREYTGQRKAIFYPSLRNEDNEDDKGGSRNLKWNINSLFL